MAPEANINALGRLRQRARQTAITLESAGTFDTEHCSDLPSSSQETPPLTYDPVAHATARVQRSSGAAGVVEAPANPRQAQGTRKRKREPPDATTLNTAGNIDSGGDDLQTGRACLFFRHDPVAHWQCAQFSFTRYADLLQHVHRKHTLGYRPYCPCCYVELGSEGDRDQHIQARDCARVDPPKHKILMDQYKELAQKSKGTMDSKWHRAWEILFPHQEKPESTLIYEDIRDALDVVADLSRRFLHPHGDCAHLEIFDNLLALLRERAMGVPAIVPVCLSGPSTSGIPLIVADMQDPVVFSDSTAFEFVLAERFPMMVTPQLPDDWQIGSEDASIRDLLMGLGADADFFDRPEDREALNEGDGA